MSDAKATSAIINTPSGTGLLGPISSLISQIQTDARNWATFGINSYYAKEDRDFQREAYEYQKELNERLFQREDTAIQRKAADLAAAGINPMIAGLAGGAQATAGTVINPGVNAQVSAGQSVNYLGEALDRLRAEKAAEKTQTAEIEAQLELQRRQINASNLADDKKIKADRQIEELQSLHRIIEARLNAKDTAEQNKLDRDLQWKIATHKALRELFTNSEVPFLDNIWKELIDNTPDDLIIDGKLNFKALKREWDKLWNEKGQEKIETRKVEQPKPGKDEKGKFHYEYIKGMYRKVYENDS